MIQQKEHSTFKDLGIYGKSPSYCKNISVHIILNIKNIRKYKTRIVEDSYLTNIPLTIIYSRVVSLYSIRILVFLCELNRLKL